MNIVVMTQSPISKFYLLVLCSIELDLTELILRVKCRHDIIALGFSTRRVVHNRGRILPRACLMPYIHCSMLLYALEMVEKANNDNGGRHGGMMIPDTAE